MESVKPPREGAGPRRGGVEFEDGRIKDEDDPARPKGCTRRANRLAMWSRRSMWVRRLAQPGTLLFGFIAAVEAALVVAAAADFPTKSIWSAHHAAWWAFNVVSVITLILT